MNDAIVEARVLVYDRYKWQAVNGVLAVLYVLGEPDNKHRRFLETLFWKQDPDVRPGNFEVSLLLTRRQFVEVDGFVNSAEYRHLNLSISEVG